jgi:exopolysaccharide biosynthesis WecB/TagA/CpsF family protein
MSTSKLSSDTAGTLPASGGPGSPDTFPKQKNDFVRRDPAHADSDGAGLRRRVYGVDVDVIDRAAAVARIVTLCRTKRGGVVVTPNLDHVLKLKRDDRFRRAYDAADLVLADGYPLVLTARLDGGPRLTRVTGADLIEPICAAAARNGLSVFMFGSTADVLDTASRLLRERHPGLRVAGLHAPPMGFEALADAQARAVAAIKAAAPDIVFVALGAPKAEIWAHAVRDTLGGATLLCIGASLDFIAGKRRRAPKLLSDIGLEWAWRMVSEPRRLGRRYLSIIAMMPALVANHAADMRRLRRTKVHGRRPGTEPVDTDSAVSAGLEP